MTRSRRRHILFALVSVLASTLFCLLLAEYTLRWYQQDINNSSVSDPGLLRYHARLGWTLSPNWQGRHSHHDFNVHYTINKYGYRVAVPPAQAENASRRIAIVGDSFSFGLGVNDEDVFVTRMNQLQENTEYVNLSVPGYSTDQQLLLLQSASVTLDVDAYILLVYLGNDILDNMLAYPLQAEQAKPYFTVDENQQLLLQNVPVPRESKPAALRSQTLSRVIFGDSLAPYQSSSLLARSQLWQQLRPARVTVSREHVYQILDQRLQPHKALMKALLVAMQSKLAARDKPLQIALLSGRSHILQPESYSAYFQEYVSLYLKTLAADLHLPLIDIAGHLQALPAATKDQLYFANEGHLNALGHRHVAEILVHALQQR